MSKTYKIWASEFESLEDARQYTGDTVREAVDYAAHDEYMRNGDFDELEFLVLEVSTGNVFTVDVMCDCVPSFCISPEKQAPVLVTKVKV